MTLGEYLVKLLEEYGVDTVFGIPGVHTVEMYRGLAESSINTSRRAMNKVRALWLTGMRGPAENPGWHLSLQGRV